MRSDHDEKSSRISARPARINILGVGAMPMDLPRAAATLESWRRSGRRDYVCCVSVHGLVVAQRDDAIRSALNGAGMATEDGMPLVWWSRRAGFRDAGRVCGPDLMELVCAASASQGTRHFFYGGSPRVLDALVARMKARHPGFILAGAMSPPFRTLSDAEDRADVEAINKTRPDYVWVGLGMPKQEAWMAAHVGRIEATALLGVGAAFDFHAGTTPRAPAWLQRNGLEWMFRLATEPRRLAHRYLVDNSMFLFHALRQWIGDGSRYRLDMPG
jgi:N-acetylglucosaminyldiphosphoundecaprenol N-acetyl-beta-D-mannosaminyltransferase